MRFLLSDMKTCRVQQLIGAGPRQHKIFVRSETTYVFGNWAFFDERRRLCLRVGATFVAPQFSASVATLTQSPGDCVDT
jgi:hypothetical protein